MSTTSVTFGTNNSTPVSFSDGLAMSVAFAPVVEMALSFAGNGDMASSTYDPTGVLGDAFDISNHYGSTEAITIDGGLI